MKCCGALLVLVVLLCFGVVAAEDYPINWAQVTTTETKIKAKDLVKCLCDLTYYQCDPDCCCDADCSTSEKALFSECTSFDKPPDDLICIDASDVSVVNRVDASEKDGQLCVIKNNNPSLGLYFSDPKTVTAANFDDFLVTEPYTYENVAALPDSLASATYAQNYKVGDSILQITTTTKSPLALPTSNFFGQCSDNNPAIFLVENQTYACNIYSSALSSDCATLFSATKYVQGIIVAKTPADTTGVPVEVNSVDGVVGASISTASYSSGACGNALQKLSYLVVHNGAGTIVNVSVDVWTTSVADWGTDLGGTASATFSIAFLNNTSPTDVVRDKSGNPGYLNGYPLLLGNATSNDGITQAISQPTTPPTIFGATASGTCVVGKGPALTFGDDLLVGCKMPVPSAVTATTASCQAFASSIMGILRGNVPTYVGKFGNANYMNIYDWANVYEITPAVSELNSAGGYCSDIPNQIQYQFITTYAGPLKAPQARIVAGQINYSAVAVSGTSAYLEVYASVSFVNIASTGVLQENLPAPPLMKSLPGDILYPFKLSSSTTLSVSFALFLLSIILLV